MKLGIRIFLAYLFFALISGAIHAGLFWTFSSEGSNAPSVEVSLPPVVSVRTENPMPEPPPQFRETLEEEEIPSTSEVPAKEIPPGPEALVKKSVAHPQPELEPEPEPDPGNLSEKAIHSIQEYRRYLAKELPPPGGKDAYIPKIHFGSNPNQENLEIMEYFGMEVIAYPPGQNYYIYIEPRTELFRKNTDIEYLDNYSNRVIFRSSPWFKRLKGRAAEEVGVSARQLVIAQLLRPSTAHYIAWKQKQAAALAGVSLEEVDACEARFVRAGIGVWIVRIESVRLRKGGKISVLDEEWARVSGGVR
jgi:hypothetical protein